MNHKYIEFSMTLINFDHHGMNKLVDKWDDLASALFTNMTIQLNYKRIK